MRCAVPPPLADLAELRTEVKAEIASLRSVLRQAELRLEAKLER